MRRLQHALAECKARREKALGIFITNGFPEPSATLALLHTIDAAGADFIELGMPFSDPLAEGLPIQKSSERALKQGVRMADAFAVVAEFRKKSQTPVLLMGYINPVFKYGIDAFCRDAQAAGVDGLILPDLPPTEAHLIQAAVEKYGLDWINLIAPNTSDARVQSIDTHSSGFVYAVSITGLTGTAIAADAVSQYLQRVRPLVQKNPLLVGFGIRSYEDVQRLSTHTDGAIVGSALINLVETLWDASPVLPLAERLAAVHAFVHQLKYGTL